MSRTAMVPPHSVRHHGPMFDNHQSAGFTLLELLCSLALVGVLLGMAAVPAGWARDVLAVGAARSAILNAAATARVLATGHGGASLCLRTRDGNLAVSTRDGAVSDTVARLGAAYGVTVVVGDGRADSTVIAFDALGLGRLANRTITVRRGAITGGVTFSAYGRGRAW